MPELNPGGARRELPAALQVGMQRRFATVERAAKDDAAAIGEDRLLTLSFSSENPVERWFGDEVLSHEKDAADFSRLNDGAPLLWGHDWNRIIGVVEKAWLDKGRGMATVRFAKTPDGDQFMGLVNDGVVRNVSFAYQVNAYRAEGDGSPDDCDTDPVYTATSWLAFEISLVSVPADQSVGVARAESGDAQSVPVQRRSPPAAPAVSSLKGNAMPEQQGGAAPQLADVKVIEDAARNAERARAAAINGMSVRFGHADLARQLIESGASIEAAQAAFLEKMPAPTPAARGPVVDLSDNDAKSFSFVRAINATLNDDWSGAGFEREVSIAIAKKLGRDQKKTSFFAPTHIPYMAKGAQVRAPYAVGAAGTGGNLVATQLLAGSFIEILRNASVTGQLGAQYLTGLVGKVAIPRRNAATGTYWVAESGAVTESEATFDQVTLQPKTIGSLSKMSRLTLLQSTPDIEMLTRSDLVAVMALGIDLAAISGSGASNQPTGIVNTAGIGSVVGGTNGANLTFDHIIQLYSAPRIANAPQQSLGFAINAKSYGYLSTTKSSTGQYLWNPGGGIYGAPADTLRGYQYAVSNQLRSNLTKGTAVGICSEAVYGNWQELLIGEWGTMEVMVNPYDSTGFANGDVIVRALQTIDIGVRHAASFAAMSDALTPGF